MQFNSVQMRRPGRSVFNLSYEKKMTMDMGQLIPVLCDEMVPGDSFTLGNECVIRFQPLVAPVLHEINAYVHYFFVPYRLLWDEWEDFITGGVDGESAPVIPRWDPTAPDTAVGTLWDYLGFPTGVIPAGALPLDFPRRAYNLIYNEYYRDETLQTEVALDQTLILNRAWSKDYFTSALPWQQRGIAPALPITGTSSAVFDTAAWFATNGTPGYGFDPINVRDDTAGDNRFLFTNSTPGQGTMARNNAYNAINRNTVDLSNASTFDVADLRLAFQIQRWMERNARAGARYTEFLIAHFGVSPRDDRLQRPEFIGGTKQPIVISEVLQTSQTDTSPQGNLAGHGISVNRQFAGKCFANEFGLIMGIMSVLPKPAYSQGINRQWLRETKYDFYFPEFANLSEQAVERAELFTSAVPAENQTIFGYQGRYNEMRYKPNQVVGQMRQTFDYWHLARRFATAPLLNAEFIECIPDKRIFAVPSEPGLIVNFGNIIKAVRPLPVMPEPGRIDH